MLGAVFSAEKMHFQLEKSRLCDPKLPFGLFLNTCNLKMPAEPPFQRGLQHIFSLLIIPLRRRCCFQLGWKGTCSAIVQKRWWKASYSERWLPFRHYLRIPPQESFHLSARIAMGWKCHLSACYCIRWKQMAHWCLSVGQFVLLYARPELVLLWTESKSNVPDWRKKSTLA